MTNKYLDKIASDLAKAEAAEKAEIKEVGHYGQMAAETTNPTFRAALLKARTQEIEHARMFGQAAKEIIQVKK